VADSATPSYFQRVHRRAQHRATTVEAARISASRQPNVGQRRYKQIKQSAPQADTPAPPTAPRQSTLVKTTPIASLGSELAQLKARQEKHHGPKWWSGIASHPVRSAFLAVIILSLSGVLAIAGPIAYRSYRAYQDVFVTQVPDQESAFHAEINPEGTPVLVANQAQESASIPEWDGTSRLTLLLLGVDKRENDYARSDTIILVNIDPVAKTARMLSIPRDLKVIIPGFGAHKINAAYAFGDANKNVPGGGPGLMMRTIETNFGINIDHFAEVDFNGFVKIVDTVGGVTLDVPYPIRDNEYPAPNNQYMRIFFPSGWQHMDGQRVLQYARTRHDDGDGRRSARQQQVLLALRQQALDLNLLKQAPTLISEVGDTVRTDLSSGQALQLARLATEINQSEIQQLTLDPALITWQTDEFYFQGDWAMIGDIMTEFTGQKIVPPMSALANPSYETTISILDGTLIPGLGPRVLDVVKSNGFADSTTVDLPDAGNYPETKIIVSPDNIATAYLLAGILGVPETAITASDDIQTPTIVATNTATATSAAAPVGTPTAGTPTADGKLDVVPLFPTAVPESGKASPAPAGEIIIILGDDLPDPAWYNVDPNAQ
jgi:polyisoprenyl-teichoic acid--peptidoglycan teichoic acid transferase